MYVKPIPLSLPSPSKVHCLYPLGFTTGHKPFMNMLSIFNAMFVNDTQTVIILQCDTNFIIYRILVPKNKTFIFCHRLSLKKDNRFALCDCRFSFHRQISICSLYNGAVLINNK